MEDNFDAVAPSNLHTASFRDWFVYKMFCVKVLRMRMVEIFIFKFTLTEVLKYFGYRDLRFITAFSGKFKTQYKPILIMTKTQC